MEWKKAQHEPMYSLDVNFGSIGVWYADHNNTWSVIADVTGSRLREKGFTTLEAAQARALAFYADALRAELEAVNAVATTPSEVTHHDDCWDARCRGC